MLNGRGKTVVRTLKAAKCSWLRGAVAFALSLALVFSEAAGLSSFAPIKARAEGYFGEGGFIAPFDTLAVVSVAIHNRAELEAMQSNGTYHLANDINLLEGIEPTDVQRAWWTPLSWGESGFTGTLDGRGYTIGNLITQRNAGGLFYEVYGVVKNIGLAYTNIGLFSAKGASHMGFDGVYVMTGGGVCAYNYGLINNCRLIDSAEVYAQVGGNASDDKIYTQVSIGGICGVNEGRVVNCYNAGSRVSATGYFNAEGNMYVDCGGIVGANSGTISNCYNTARVGTDATLPDAENAGEMTAGGIAGISTGDISECFNVGNIESLPKAGLAKRNHIINAYAGGIAGKTAADYSVKNCYSVGEVKAWGSANDKSFAGGITGWGWPGNYCYWNNEKEQLKFNVAQTRVGAGGGEAKPGSNFSKGLTTAQMKQKASYTVFNWRFAILTS